MYLRRNFKIHVTDVNVYINIGGVSQIPIGFDMGTLRIVLNCMIVLGHGEQKGQGSLHYIGLPTRSIDTLFWVVESVHLMQSTQMRLVRAPTPRPRLSRATMRLDAVWRSSGLQIWKNRYPLRSVHVFPYVILL